MLLLVYILLIAVTLADDNLNLNTEVPNNYENNTVTGVSCEDFVENTTFDPNSIVDIDWTIFYVWNFYGDDQGYTVRFSVPTESLLDRFSMELSKEYPTVNWTDAVLFMESTINFSGLFVKTNTSGILFLISFDALEYVVPISTMKFGFKLAGGYLGIETCAVRLCIALAPIGKRPPDHQLEEAASKLGFHSDFNTSLVLNTSPKPPLNLFGEQLDDQEDEEDFDIDHDPGKMQFVF